VKRSYLALYGALIFFGGLAVGILGHRLYSSTTVSATTAPRGPEDWRRQFTGEMKTRVQLDTEQMERLNVILDESRELFHQVREKYRPEMRAIHDAQVARIKRMLRPEQQNAYSAIVEEQRAAREAKERGAK
jgi:hypothetical protein